MTKLVIEYVGVALSKGAGAISIIAQNTGGSSEVVLSVDVTDSLVSIQAGSVQIAITGVTFTPDTAYGV
ncbi:MAG: hypothetical protein V2I33_19575 [Kangiellaceae bacterium]|nr:hypothetical protein [Kangiellaceae bacterium]